MNDGYMMACNYHPKGNIKGEPVYKTGRPCTDCSLDRPSCSRIFKGLCGIGNDLINCVCTDFNCIEFLTDRSFGHRLKRNYFLITVISLSVIIS